MDKWVWVEKRIIGVDTLGTFGSIRKWLSIIISDRRHTIGEFIFTCDKFLRINPKLRNFVHTKYLSCVTPD